MVSMDSLMERCESAAKTHEEARQENCNSNPDK